MFYFCHYILILALFFKDVSGYTINYHLFLHFKIILKKFEFFLFFYFKLISFSVFKLFVLKNKKIYYFNIFLNKKYFKKQF
jgi:hypothetical protein